MKKVLIFIGLGIFNLLLLFIFLKFILFSIPYGILFISITLFLSGIAVNKVNFNPYWKVFLICLPMLIFSFVLINETKYLWPTIFYFPLITFFGVIFSQKKIILSIISTAVILIFSLNIAPDLIFKSLIIKIDEKPISYSLTNLLENKLVTNTDNKSQIVVLSFFNTWCVPCIKEFPELEKLKEKYQKKNVKIVLVCAGEMDTKEKVLSFYKKRNLEFDLWYDENSEMYKLYKMSGVPTTMIINRDGKLVHMHTGYNEGINIFKQLSKIIDKNL